jgi:hypothetical protein
MTVMRKPFTQGLKTALLASCCFALLSCADANVPEGRSVDIPAAGSPHPREKAVNENVDSITRIQLGVDALVPRPQSGSPLPQTYVGPYELRGETVAGALQLITAEFDMPLAFETDAGLERRITVSNLKGPLDKVISRVCGLGDLYCSYEDEALIVKDTETFVVALPPLGDDFSFDDIATGLESLTGIAPTIDAATNTMIYSTTARNAVKAENYFKRLRANTALVVYETYIWEVALDSINSAGIQWEHLSDLGNFNTGISLAGAISNQVGTPISIGLPTKGPVNLAVDDVVRFISEQGAVKTISQPQLTVLSGSSATLAINERTNYVESFTRTIDELTGDETISTSIAEVENGFNLTIASKWDDSTVYGDIDIELQELLGFDPFDAGGGETVNLPRTSERSLQTQVRVRPGDSILIAGLVRERDQFDTSGPGFMTPLIPVDRTVQTVNTELVFLLRPRVIVYDSPEDIATAPIDKHTAVIPAAEQVINVGEVKVSEEVVTELPMGQLDAHSLNPSLSPVRIPEEQEDSATNAGQEQKTDLPMGSLDAADLNPASDSQGGQ